MPSSIATLVFLSAIGALLWWDSRRRHDCSPALWLPVLWLFIVGSRFVSQWLNLGQPEAVNYDGSSPIDAGFFLMMLVLGTAVLAQRGVSLAVLTRHNFWIVLFMLWGLSSVAWSDDSVVAFKRWVKVLGHPVMALIIVTDANPREALCTVLRRCAILLMPLSVLLIKYWPQWGRSFDLWTGEAANTGVGLTKNDLGYTSMVCALFFAWSMLAARKLDPGPARRNEVIFCAGGLACAIWLLSVANSATSLTALVLGLSVMALTRMTLISYRWLGVTLMSLAALAWAAEAAFGVSAMVLELLDRKPTLTDRTIIWSDVLAMQERPLIGYGFESFWLGARLEVLWEKWWWKPNQAHNGYIETYLNLGAVGLFLLVALLFATFFKIKRSFEEDIDFARLQMALFVAVLAFNYAEAGFKGVHFMWTILWILALRYPLPVPPDRAGETLAMAQPAAGR